MVKENVVNPFFIGRYAGARYFCDRVKETQTLVKHIRNGRNVALISPRRLGKSGLIYHTFEQAEIKGHYTPIYVDIYSTGNLSEFAHSLSISIVSALQSEPTWFERVSAFLKSLRVGFKLDPISGEPAFDLSLGQIEYPEKTIRELFEYMESLEKPCVLAIDEFQQIREYPEHNTEAYIRTLVQKCSRTTFIFCGSKRHIMTDMFFSPSRKSAVQHTCLMK